MRQPVHEPDVEGRRPSALHPLLREGRAEDAETPRAESVAAAIGVADESVAAQRLAGMTTPNTPVITPTPITSTLGPMPAVIGSAAAPVDPFSGTGIVKTEHDDLAGAQTALANAPAGKHTVLIVDATAASATGDGIVGMLAHRNDDNTWQFALQGGWTSKQGYKVGVVTVWYL